VMLRRRKKSSSLDLNSLWAVPALLQPR
jgi:hypothetical protein